MKKLYIFLIILVFISGCNYFRIEPENKLSENSIEKNSLTFPILIKVETDKPVYFEGETVKMKLEAKNVGVLPITLEFLTSQRFDFIVMFNDRELWRWSKDKVFLQVVDWETLLPGESLVYKIAEYKGDRIGTMELVGILTSNPPYKGVTNFVVLDYLTNLK